MTSVIRTIAVDLKKVSMRRFENNKKNFKYILNRRYLNAIYYLAACRKLRI